MKTYHMAHLVGNHGEMSALCFASPRAIDLGKASWTLRREAVTCGKCRAAIRALEAVAAKGGPNDGMAGSMAQIYQQRAT